MKMPINCPICNDVLASTFSQSIDLDDFLAKECSTKLNHTIIYSSDNYDYDIVLVIRLQLNDFVIYWMPKLDEKQALYKSYTGYSLEPCVKIEINNKELQMEWFEPDFSDLPKLIRKIETYLLFA